MSLPGDSRLQDRHYARTETVHRVRRAANQIDGLRTDGIYRLLPVGLARMLDTEWRHLDRLVGRIGDWDPEAAGQAELLPVEPNAGRPN